MQPDRAAANMAVMTALITVFMVQLLHTRLSVQA